MSDQNPSVKEIDIDDYRIGMRSWHYAQRQLRLRLLFHFSKKKLIHKNSYEIF